MDERKRGLGAVQVAKIVFAFAGLVTFGAGVRLDNIWVRWAGIGLVAVAWSLRFAKRPQLPDDTR